MITKNPPPLEDANAMQLLNLVSLLFGIISFLCGAALWWKGSIEKRYAAERDFKHLKGNQEQMAQGLGHIDEAVGEVLRNNATVLEEMRRLNNLLSELNRTYLEMKTFQQAMNHRLEIIAAYSDAPTLGHKPRTD